MKTAAALLAALILAPAAAAKDGVHATLIRPLPHHASTGTELVVAFTLTDAAGRPFDAQRVFVKIVCPTKDAWTVTFAPRGAHPSGRYRIVATVPPGGLGIVGIGVRGRSTAGGTADVFFPIVNR